MVKKRKIPLTLVVIIGFAFGLFPIWTEAAGQEDNLIVLHRNAKGVKSSQCINCHGDKGKDVSLEPKIPPAHAIHVGTLKLECNGCHKSVDLRERSAAGLRRQVDVKTCTACHNGKTAKLIYRR